MMGSLSLHKLFLTKISGVFSWIDSRPLLYDFIWNSNVFRYEFVISQSGQKSLMCDGIEIFEKNPQEKGIFLKETNVIEGPRYFIPK